MRASISPRPGASSSRMIPPRRQPDLVRRNPEAYVPRALEQSGCLETQPFVRRLLRCDEKIGPGALEGAGDNRRIYGVLLDGRRDFRIFRPPAQVYAGAGWGTVGGDQQLPHLGRDAPMSVAVRAENIGGQDVGATDEVGDEGCPRLVINLLGRPLLLDAAVPHDQHAV